MSAFRTKHMKATDEEIIEAVDGEMCPEQAEKLRIIREHMSSLDLCKTNLQSLIMSTAEKYIPEIELICTVPGMATFLQIPLKTLFRVPCLFALFFYFLSNVLFFRLSLSLLLCWDYKD